MTTFGIKAGDVRVAVLDVGHGNCAVLRDDHGCVVFDLPSGPIPQDYFDAVGIRRIDALLVSHPHKDHCEGLAADFGERYPIDVIFMNRRLRNQTRLYRQVIQGIRRAKAGPNPPRVVPFTSDVREMCLSRGPVTIKLLAPAGDTGYDDEGASTSEHTHCGVARIDHASGTRVLIPGDLSAAGMRAILADDPDALRADVLIFPHHGGLPGSANPSRFAQRLTECVGPELIVFSQARDEAGRPRQEIVDGVREAAPNCHIACTELSWRCDERELHFALSRADSDLPSAGSVSSTSACCAGTFEVEISSGSVVFPSAETHKAFVQGSVNSPRCG